jgi:hypothetical protein
VTALAIAPDGRTLASAAYDGTVTLWDLATVRAGRPDPVPPADPAALWDTLADPDAARAYAAVVALRDAGDEAVKLLRERLPPATVVPADRLDRLAAELDAAAFAARQRATAELAGLDEQARPALERALAGRPSAELRRRAEKLLADLDGFLTDPRRLREVRAVEVLEAVGSPAARALLGELARGDPAARLTQEARSALGRSERLDRLRSRLP